MEILLHTLAVVALTISSITDLKTREVPDTISYSLIIGALGTRLLYALGRSDSSIFFEGIFGFITGVTLGYGMYYLRQWGGGDAKLLMGLGALIGFDLTLSSPLVFYLIAILFAGGFYGLGWLMYLGIQHRHNIVQKIKHTKHPTPVLLAATGVLLLVPSLFQLYVLAAFAVFPFFLYSTWLATKTLEEQVFKKKVHPSKLTEGDWIEEDIVVHGRTIVARSDLGVDLQQIAELRKLAAAGKIQSVTIKEGIPFAPTFLLGYGALLLKANLLLLVL